MEQLRMQIVDEVAQEMAVSSRGQHRQRALKRKMKNWPVKKRGIDNSEKINMAQAIIVIK